MGNKMVDVTLHLDENLSNIDREELRDHILQRNGVAAAAYHDEKPHLIVVEYDPDVINSSEFVKIASDRGIHAELIGL